MTIDKTVRKGFTASWRKSRVPISEDKTYGYELIAKIDRESQGNTQLFMWHFVWKQGKL